VPSPFTQKVKALIRQIPAGKVASYGLLAALAGNPRAARQVAWILHSSSAADQLPWHRVVNRNGKISLKPFEGYELQKQRLLLEGVVFDENEAIDFDLFLWRRP
jgi:methylated-DNA-protein-cysteine methyltransferase-like protein